MQIREPILCQVALDAGVLKGASGRYVKTFGELTGLYADEAAYHDMHRARSGEIVYEVTEVRPSAAPGDVIFGMTRMAPGRVGAEYFMTRGHIHATSDRPEVYYGQRGQGVMLMETPAGETSVVAIGPQTICYVPPYWIHRSVNVGDEDFVMMFVYPADSGQDYDIIARSGGMKLRILEDGAGGWTAVDNPAYRPRSPDEVERILGQRF